MRVFNRGIGVFPEGSKVVSQPHDGQVGHSESHPRAARHHNTLRGSPGGSHSMLRLEGIQESARSE
jgi:hypothetical protein